MLLTTDHGAARELQMNRPPVNALTTELLRAIREAVKRAPSDGARMLILSGLPGRFSAGLDLPFLLSQNREGIAELWRELYATIKALACSPIPIAAAITGHAPAGGTVLSIFCDWRVMADGDFRLGLNEVQVGIPLPPVIHIALRRLVGIRHAERLAVDGTMITAQHAFQIGLVDELALPDQVIPRAIGWCDAMLALPPTAMSITRREARADLTEYFSRPLDAEINKMSDAWWSSEAQATLRAVLAKMKRKQVASSE
jgi:Delta3-Delta2-enoyl-CoA isomerase